MKHIFLTYLLLAVFGSFSADAQSKKVKDDIYYTAEDAQRDADEAEKERQALEAARAKRAAEREANNSATVYDSGEEEYIDYDNDEYYYSNRFNRFNGPYYGASYWAYDPFFWDPWWGGGYYARGWGMGPSWGWGPSWGVGVGFGGPYWSSYWGWNCWYGYPGFYSAWNSPWYGGGFGGYYNGFYDGYYAGAYGGGAIRNVRTVTYGPRSSINRYPGSLRSAGTRTATGTGTNGGTRGQLREAGENRTYSRSANPAGTPGSGIGTTERRGTPSSGRYNPAESPRNNNRYNSGATNRPSRNYGTNGNNNPGQAEPAQQRTPSRTYQRSEPSYQRSQPAQQQSQPSYQRSQPSYSAPSRSSSPSRTSGGGYSSGGRTGGGRR